MTSKRSALRVRNDRPSSCARRTSGRSAIRANRAMAAGQQADHRLVDVDPGDRPVAAPDGREQIAPAAKADHRDRPPPQVIGQRGHVMSDPVERRRVAVPLRDRRPGLTVDDHPRCVDPLGAIPQLAATPQERLPPARLLHHHERMAVPDRAIGALRSPELAVLRVGDLEPRAAGAIRDRRDREQHREQERHTPMRAGDGPAEAPAAERRGAAPSTTSELTLNRPPSSSGTTERQPNAAPARSHA